jgi:hypothetical protein
MLCFLFFFSGAIRSYHNFYYRAEKLFKAENRHKSFPLSGRLLTRCLSLHWGYFLGFSQSTLIIRQACRGLRKNWI